MPIHQKVAVFAVGLMTAATIASVTAPVQAATTDQRAASAITWGPCEGVPSSPLKCGTVSVPLDYQNPGGTKIEVAVSKLPAAKPSARRGVLLLNPGGPGGSGLLLPATVAQLAPVSLTDSYDLIGFDPRGLGKSNPLSCGLTPEEASKVIPYPAPGGFDATVAAQKKIVKSCFDTSGAQLPYITTANTARDMDQIRLALGEQKISYFGISYGTYLGSVYASLFPRQTDRFVLDSAVGPGLVWRDEFRNWGPAVEERFGDFAKWAAARSGTYELGKTAAQVRATFFRLADQLTAHPRAGIDGDTFREVTRGGLYGDTKFPNLAKAWQQLGGTNPAEAASTIRSSGLLAQPADDGIATLLGVLCGDTRWSRSLDQYRTKQAHDAKKYPMVGMMAGNVWPCAFWPQAPKEPLVKISSNGPSNILIMQNRRDPATIYSGGVQLRKQFGKRAKLVSVDQGGHGVYLMTQNACANNIGTQFLVRGTFPTADKQCGAGDTVLRSKSQGDERARLVQELHQAGRPF